MAEMTTTDNEEKKLYDILKDGIEKVAMRKIATKRDFEYLSIHIMDRTGAYISPITIRRFWGELAGSKYNVQPHRYTLDTMARYIGYTNYETFSKSCIDSGNANSDFIASAYLIPNTNRKETRFHTALESGHLMDAELASIDRLDSNGGTSEAYVVTINGKKLFMKRLRPEFADDPKYRILFEKEYELGKSLNSPYIPQYVSMGNDNEGPYILMEYVIGENIGQKLESDPAWFLKEKNIRRMLLQLLEGLQELHRKDILYMDINPRNIMLTKFGNNVKIVDLGFCSNAAYSHTAGCSAGFSAPEVEEFKEIDVQSDIFSVGLLLRYIKEHTGAKFSQHLKRFMYRCLRKEKKQRFKDTEEAISALKRKNRWHIMAISCCIIAIAVLLPFLLTKKETELALSATFNGVDYRILSQEELTCIVVGGEGKNNNIYIEPEITIHGKVYRTVAISDSAFKRRDSLSVHIPEGVEVIGKGAFYYCDSVVTMNIPNSVKEFSGAFIDMRSLRKVKLPVAKEISSLAFVATDIEDIHIPEGVERICLDAFVSCARLKNISFPQTLKVLERGVFYNCQALQKIVIPANVQEIGDYAFYECDSLKAVYIHATVPPRITAIFNTADVKVYVPEDALDSYKKDFNWGEYDINPMPANEGL